MRDHVAAVLLAAVAAMYFRRRRKQHDESSPMVCMTLNTAIALQAPDDAPLVRHSSERGMVERCKRAGQDCFLNAARFVLDSNVDVLFLQEFWNAAPFMRVLGTRRYRLLRPPAGSRRGLKRGGQVCAIVHRAGMELDPVPIGRAVGVRCFCAAHHAGSNTFFVSMWLGHMAKGHVRAIRSIEDTLLAFLRARDIHDVPRVIVGVDSNDYRGTLLGKEFELCGATLRVPKMAHTTCCEDSGYSMPGDYLLDSEAGGSDRCRIALPRGTDARSQLLSDHLPVVLTTRRLDNNVGEKL